MKPIRPLTPIEEAFSGRQTPAIWA